LFKLDIDHLVSVSLLRSDRWLYELLSDSQLNVGHLAVSALLDYQQYSQRKDDNEAALSNISFDNSNKNYSLDFIGDLGERFLDWNGHNFEVKVQYLDEWQSLCSYIDPLIVLAWMYSEKIRLGELKPEQFSGLSQCAQALQFDQTCEYADNHAHLAGHGSHRKAIFDFSFEAHYVNSRKSNWPTLNEFSFINSGLIEQNELPRLLHSLFSFLIERILFNKPSVLPSFSDITSRQHSNRSLKALINLEQVNISAILLKEALKSDVDNGCLLLYTALFYAQRYMKLDQDWQSGLRAYIHTNQILRASMIHRGIGLGYFVEFFRHKTRKGIDQKKYKHYSIQNDISKNIFREFKVSPGVAERKSLGEISKHLLSKNLSENVQFCIHFTRSGNSKDKLQRAKRLSLEKERNRLSRLFSSFEAQNFRPAKIEGSLHEKSVNLLNLIRGLDIAGDENELPVEVFAPTLRFLRSCPWNSAHPDFKPTRKLHLSVHVGEDFKHIISGLRHIDETVIFCEMNHGDRLGHALALGINPGKWALRQGTSLLSAGEHLDNLVWLHHQAVKVSMKLPAITPLIHRLESKVRYWSDYIYGESLDPQSLYFAWKLRRNCPITYMKMNGEFLNHLKVLMPDFGKTTPSDRIIGLWQSYFMSFNKYSLNGGNDKYQKQIKVRHIEDSHPDAVTNSDLRVDFFSLEELNYIIAIQDYLMHIYDQNGIVIEACPSSNIYTGLFNNYSEHPIYRWNPPNKTSLNIGESNNLFGLRFGPIKVCINTDDAGLFPTTIANEHRVIKETAIKDLGICSEDADSWMRRIREVGITEFKKNKMPLIN